MLNACELLFWEHQRSSLAQREQCGLHRSLSLSFPLPGSCSFCCLCMWLDDKGSLSAVCSVLQGHGNAGLVSRPAFLQKALLQHASAWLLLIPSHCAPGEEQAGRTGRGYTWCAELHCPPDEGLEWDAAAAGRQVQALDLGREGEVVRGA